MVAGLAAVMVKPYKRAPAFALALARRLGAARGAGAADLQHLPGGAKDTEGNAAERAAKALRAHEARDPNMAAAMQPPAWFANDAERARWASSWGIVGTRDPSGDVAHEVTDAFATAADAAYVAAILAHFRAVAAPFYAAERARIRRAKGGKPSK